MRKYCGNWLDDRLTKLHCVSKLTESTQEGYQFLRKNDLIKTEFSHQDFRDFGPKFLKTAFKIT